MNRELTEEEDQEVSRYSYILAKQWLDWPCALFSGLGQLLLLNTNIHNHLFFLHVSFHNKLLSFDFYIPNVFILFIILEVVWFLISEKFVSFKLAFLLRWVPPLVFFTTPGVAIALFIKGYILFAVIALFWPFILTAVSFITYLLLDLFFSYVYNLSQPRIEIIQVKMKAAMLRLSPEETDYYVKMAEQLMKEMEHKTATIK